MLIKVGNEKRNPQKIIQNPNNSNSLTTPPNTYSFTYTHTHIHNYTHTTIHTHIQLVHLIHTHTHTLRVTQGRGTVYILPSDVTADEEETCHTNALMNMKEVSV